MTNNKVPGQRACPATNSPTVNRTRRKKRHVVKKNIYQRTPKIKLKKKICVRKKRERINKLLEIDN